MKKEKLLLGAFLLVFTVFITACSNNEGEMNTNENTGPNEETNEEMSDESSGSEEEMDHSDMNHSSSEEVPKGLEEADKPTYEVGDTATITDGHMSGMEGAEATIKGAYHTIAYVVSYTPVNGGERVTDHKWVIHEEIKEAGEEPFEPGDKVTLNASHMEGMNGATATIESAEETTVFMVDFENMDSGNKIENHKWVTEGELSVD
ncbi:YdhK family protein [Halobacillus litoralis]|uniref:YdhK family protein n=1 Tax=Halobacillus litoralis TaxID=45668 RepID=UPI001CD57CC7|nr:YdhK family protein [Halobacillus litoralis]MCA1023674.1 YdhK family protein [Halobacillus litoralis]